MQYTRDYTVYTMSAYTYVRNNKGSIRGLTQLFFNFVET